MSGAASKTDRTVAESIALVDAVGPICNGHDTLVVISALSALLGTAIHRHCEHHKVSPERLLDVVCRNTRDTAKRVATQDAVATRH